jgi:hypothetical protein
MQQHLFGFCIIILLLSINHFVLSYSRSDTSFTSPRTKLLNKTVPDETMDDFSRSGKIIDNNNTDIFLLGRSVSCTIIGLPHLCNNSNSCFNIICGLSKIFKIKYIAFLPWDNCDNYKFDKKKYNATIFNLSLPKCSIISESYPCHDFYSCCNIASKLNNNLDTNPIIQLNNC